MKSKTITELIAERDRAIFEKNRIIDALTEERESLKEIVTTNQYGSAENIINKIKSLIENTSKRLDL